MLEKAFKVFNNFFKKKYKYLLVSKHQELSPEYSVGVSLNSPHKIPVCMRTKGAQA